MTTPEYEDSVRRVEGAFAMRRRRGERVVELTLAQGPRPLATVNVMRARNSRLAVKEHYLGVAMHRTLVLPPITPEPLVREVRSMLSWFPWAAMRAGFPGQFRMPPAKAERFGARGRPLAERLHVFRDGGTGSVSASLVLAAETEDEWSAALELRARWYKERLDLVLEFCPARVTRGGEYRVEPSGVPDELGPDFKSRVASPARARKMVARLRDLLKASPEAVRAFGLPAYVALEARLAGPRANPAKSRVPRGTREVVRQVDLPGDARMTTVLWVPSGMKREARGYAMTVVGAPAGMKVHLAYGDVERRVTDDEPDGYVQMHSYRGAKVRQIGEPVGDMKWAKEILPPERARAMLYAALQDNPHALRAHGHANFVRLLEEFGPIARGNPRPRRKS
jgi:hypothetical protein